MPVPVAPGTPGPWTSERLLARIAEGGPSLVALSGGVDSAVVAVLLHRALGDRAQAVTLTGPAVAAEEVERAERVARAIGVPHALLPVDPLALPEYRANPSNRCFFCRQVEMGAIRAWGDARGRWRYVDGVHRDDLLDDRPGLRAMQEAGFEHPLLAAGWGKAEVRAFARAAGLPNAEAPSEACLASRIRHGQPISAELLGRVERAEAEVRARGFRRVRVRVDGATARVVVDPEETPRLLAAPLSTELAAALARLGFDAVVLDPVGYRRRPGA